MPINLSGRSFLKMLDFTPEEILYLIDLSADLKQKKRDGVQHKYLEGKNIVLLFEKTSTRTRCSFEVGAYDLGMGATYLGPGSSQVGKKESIEDTGKVLGRIYDGIEYRGFGQEIVEKLAEAAGVPVWNGLTDECHPTQMIADMLTVKENFPRGFEGLKLVFMGDCRNNVANSLMITCVKLGMHFTACGPKELWPTDELVKRAQEIASHTQGSVTMTDSVDEGANDADIVYTDIWVSMGEPENVWAERIKLLSPYQVNEGVMALTADDSIFMHCLPSYHDLGTDVGREINDKFGISEMEVTDEVFRSAKSRVFDEAENRMHSIKAIMYATLK